MYFRGLRKTAGDLSLSESIDIDGDGNSLSLMDIIAQDDDMLERVSLVETREFLNRFVERDLTEREAEIVRMRYGLDGQEPKTQREVAKICGISRSYVYKTSYYNGWKPLKNKGGHSFFYF